MVARLSQAVFIERELVLQVFVDDRIAGVEGTLMGIKGQYLIFDTGVINLRKYTGYEMSLAA